MAWCGMARHHTASHVVGRVRVVWQGWCGKTPHCTRAPTDQRDLARARIRRKPHKKPLTRQYFAVPLPSGNQAEQFFHFTSLVRHARRGFGWGFMCLFMRRRWLAHVPVRAPVLAESCASSCAAVARS
eukprot:365852-Chlamydomonas_euryale.AAC.2